MITKPGEDTSIRRGTEPRAKPFVNVTPLIDVLLVVLIIFMVMSPLKPARFLAKVPSKPDQNLRVDPWPLQLVVTIKPDLSLMLNGLSEMGSVNDTSRLSAKLTDLIQQRLKNHAYSAQFRDRPDLPEAMRIEKTVFIKAPRASTYADVMCVLDSITGTGGYPVGLQ